MPNIEKLVNTVLHDELEARWHAPRALVRLVDPHQREEALRMLEELLRDLPSDWKTRYRLLLACTLLKQPLSAEERVIIREKGAYERKDADTVSGKISRS